MKGLVSMPRSIGFFFTSASACIPLLFASVARADPGAVAEPPAATAPVPATDSADVVRIGAVIHGSAREARNQRLAFMTAGFVAGAAMVPAGAVLSQRSNVVAQAMGVGLLAGGGTALAISLLHLIPSSIEGLEDVYEERRASGVDSARWVADFETQWADGARASHSRRIWFGVLELVAGAALTGTGLGLLLTGPVDGNTKSPQYNWGSSFVGGGVPFMSLAIHTLIQDSPLESSWATYKALGGQPGPVRPASVTGFDVIPLRGGALACATLSM
jgi:hypothetical protein